MNDKYVIMLLTLSMLVLTSPLHTGGQSEKAENTGQVEAIPEEEKPRVLYFLRYLSGKKIAGQGTYNDFYINLAGGVNSAGDMYRFPDVSEEQIIAWDPPNQESPRPFGRNFLPSMHAHLFCHGKAVKLC